MIPSHADHSPSLPATQRLALSLLIVCAALVAHPPQAVAQSDSASSRPTLIVGERLSYDVKFGPLRVGRATMEVLGIETVRGRAAWHTRFQVSGGTLFFKVDDVLESWIDVETFSSLRFRQKLSEGSRDRLFEYEIFPERAAFTENGKPERPSVSRPLDEGSFLYFIRTMALEVGATYEFQRYFIPDRNPVRLDILRTESLEVPAGRFDALVIRPVIKAKGVFSENGRAQIWLSNDANHVLLQMTSHLAFGTISLHLRSRAFRPQPDSTKTVPEVR